MFETATHQKKFSSLVRLLHTAALFLIKEEDEARNFSEIISALDPFLFVSKWGHFDLNVTIQWIYSSTAIAFDLFFRESEWTHPWNNNLLVKPCCCEVWQKSFQKRFWRMVHNRFMWFWITENFSKARGKSVLLFFLYV